MGVHQADYLKRQRSVNPCGVRSFIPAPKRPPCHKVLRVNHYRFKSYEEWVKKASRGGGTTREPYNLSLITADGSRDSITDDHTMDWYIHRVKANLKIAFSYWPCHVQADVNYYNDLDVRWQMRTYSQKGGEPDSWMRHVAPTPEPEAMVAPAEAPTPSRTPRRSWPGRAGAFRFQMPKFPYLRL
jgi:hypothetical protein